MRLIRKWLKRRKKFQIKNCNTAAQKNKKKIDNNKKVRVKSVKQGKNINEILKFYRYTVGK